MTRPCRACGAPVLWATTEAGRPIPLDPDTVMPASPGAYCLIGTVAFQRPGAARRMVRLFGVDDAAADELAQSDYLWHVSHMATCQAWGSADES